MLPVLHCIRHGGTHSCGMSGLTTVFASFNNICLQQATAQPSLIFQAMLWVVQLKPGHQTTALLRLLQSHQSCNLLVLLPPLLLLSQCRCVHHSCRPYFYFLPV